MKELFRKYQRPLLKLANNKWGRKFLGIDTKEKIVGLTDNAFVIRLGRNKYQATVRCYPVYAKRLHYALTAIDIAEDWVTRNKAIYQPLPQYAGLLNYVGLTRDARFPNIMLLESGDIFSTAAGDGNTAKTSTSWSTARANNADAAGTGATTVGTDILLDGSTYYVYRMFTPFDISSLGALASVTAGTFSLMPSVVTANNGNWNVVETTQASATTLTVSDHANFNTTRLKTTDVNSWTADTYTNFTLNASGYAIILAASGGAVKIAGRVDKDIDNSAPSGPPQYNNITMYTSDQSGTTKDPKLVFTYTLAIIGDVQGYFEV
jgi:hypothetical protein